MSTSWVLLFEVFWGYSKRMKKLLLLFIFLSFNSFSQKLELYTSYCKSDLDCSNCKVEDKIEFLIDKSTQVVISTNTELSTNTTKSQTLKNCSIFDEKNFICGDKKTLTRTDGVLVTLDNRMIIKNGLFEDRPHATFLDKNGRTFVDEREKMFKTCHYKKNIFGNYSVVK
jgi:hypothetical protein